MKRVLRRIATALALLVAAVYVLALGNLWLNENALVFAGADLDAEETPILGDQSSTSWGTVRVTTEDGVAILLLEDQQTDSRNAPWVIYFYGQEGQVADDKNLAMYSLFRRAGLNVLAVEYRGYGASEKTKPTEAGVYADARAAWQHLHGTRGVSPGRVVLYGYSLGGGVAIQLATEMKPAGLITEGTFTSMAAAVRAHYPWLPAGLVMRNRFENLAKARSLSTPWLLLHGRPDSKVPIAHAEALAGTTAGPRHLVTLECGHEDAHLVQREQLERALKSFVGELFDLDHRI
jgi:pimeloyl-ACP methyl ester carboxylesterase